MKIRERVRAAVSGAWEDPAAHPGRQLVLSSLAGVYGNLMRLRNAAYDSGAIPRHAPSIPVVSVGNLTVGGSGKTPVAAAIARRLADLGHRPAIVLRGYGEDEILLHAELNPDVPVFADADRVEAVRAAASAGARVAVLDDGFQHRRLRRTLDIVLVSADSFGRHRRAVLPAGPFREPLRGLRRADLIFVTHKSVSASHALEVGAMLSEFAAGVPVAIVELVADGLVPLREPARAAAPLERLAGRRIVAVSSIADPTPFHRTLESGGAAVEPLVFEDHHRYTERDVVRMSSVAGGRAIVTTGKDAVKLRRLPTGRAEILVVRQSVRFADPELLGRMVEGALGDA